MSEPKTTVLKDYNERKEKFLKQPNEKPPRRQTFNKSETAGYQRDYMREYRKENGNGYVLKGKNKEGSMEERKQEFLNQMKNISNSLVAFTELESDDLVHDDKLIREMILLQKSANKLKYDLEILSSKIERERAPEPKEEESQERDMEPMTRFASNVGKVITAFEKG